MKKLLFTLFVVCLSAGAFAQLNGGLKAGINFSGSKADNGSSSNTSSGTGFHIGAYADFALSDAITLQPELLYNSLDFDGDKLSYLSIPVMFQYGFADGKFNVQAGPEIGFLMSADPSELKDDDYVTGTNFSLDLGAGANFGKLNVTARYCIGLSNIAGSTITDVVSDYSLKVSNFQLSVGYKLFGE